MTPSEIEIHQKRRWIIGRRHYRGDADIGFVGDPVEELAEELLDGRNYIGVAASTWRLRFIDAMLWAALRLL